VSLLRRTAAAVCALDAPLSGRRLRIVLAVLLALSATFVALCVQSIVTAAPPYKFGDFQALWTSGFLAHNGEPTTNYDPQTLHLRQVALGMRADEHNPFPYPPIFLLILAPLGGLSRVAAFALFMGVTFAGYLWASTGGRWRDWPALLGAFAAPATGVNLIFGQSGFLAAGLMLGGLGLVERRPIVAGVLFGLLAYKPQLGVLVPVVLVGARCWRALAAACATVVACAAAATVAFGANIWAAWVSSLLDYSRMTMVDRLMPTVAGSLRSAGAPNAVALAAQAVVAIAVGVVVWRACRGGMTPRVAALAVVGAFLATPHALNYDLPMTTAAVVWWLDRRVRASHGLFVGEIIVLSLALALPLAELVFGGHASPLAWAPMMALFALIAVDPYAARAATTASGAEEAWRAPRTAPAGKRVNRAA
jgi:alpha-1,2-mannosyltransferase